MSNIIDKIQLSGVTYDIGGGGGTVSSAITSGDTNAVAGGAVYDKFDEVEQVTAQALNVLNESLSGKQDTLSAGTGIDITSNVISVTGSTGGKAIEAGRGISVTTGATADTISVSLPISAGTGTYSIIENSFNNTVSGNYSHAEGNNTTASGSYSHAEGYNTTAGTGSFTHAEGAATKASGHYSHAEGGWTKANGYYSHAEGYFATTQNEAEHASGRYNVSSSASTTFGHSGNTLFSVGNGTSTSARHNAFEIRQNGDIYLSSGGTDIKLQDHLGGGGSSYTAGDGIDISSNDVISVTGKVSTSDFNTYSAATDSRLAEDEEVTAAALNNLNEALSGKQDTLIAGENITISGNVISATGGGGGGTVSSAITSGDTNAVAGGAVFDAVVYSGNTYTTELTFDANGYAENWIVGQSAITIDVSGYTSNTSADYYFQNSNGEELGYAHIYKMIGSWDSQWNNEASNCTITTDGDTATTATITDIPSGTVKIRRMGGINPPKAIISGDTPEIWIKDALDDHRDNSSIHVTTSEKNAWNNKSNFSGSYNDLTDKPIPDSALTSYSTNAVQSKTLYDELRITNGGETETTLTIEGHYSTNYPEGCTKLKVEVAGSNSHSIISFWNDWNNLGFINVNNYGSISVDTNGFQGAATYEISGTTVIISYPTVTNVTKIQVDGEGNYVYKAVTTEPPTVLKDQVVANTTALGGLSLVKLTQTEYDNLQTKDSNTLYVIVN